MTDRLLEAALIAFQTVERVRYRLRSFLFGDWQSVWNGKEFEKYTHF